MKQSFKKFLFKHFTPTNREVKFIGHFQKSGLHNHSEAYKESEIDFISTTLFQPKTYLTDVEVIEKVHSYIWGKKYYQDCTVFLVNDTIVIQKGWR